MLPTMCDLLSITIHVPVTFGEPWAREMDKYFVAWMVIDCEVYLYYQILLSSSPSCSPLVLVPY